MWSIDEAFRGTALGGQGREAERRKWPPREASFLYAVDFRTGKNVFARGALMAAEMDDRINARSEGKKSLRDAFRWLPHWSAENRKPFQVEDPPDTSQPQPE